MLTTLFATCFLCFLLHTYHLTLHNGLATYQISSSQTVKFRELRVVRPNCSFTVFRQTANNTTDGYLPGDGIWERNSRRELSRFYPSLCSLQHGVKIPSEEATTCLRRQNIRYIVVLGDSNGMRYFTALHWHLSQLPGVKCTPVAQHFVINWTTYEHNMHIIHRCRCGSTNTGRCSIAFKKVGPKLDLIHDWVLQARCNNIEAGSEFSVALEFTMVRYTIETKTSYTRQTGCQPSPDSQVIPATSDTTQRFLFAEFFADPRPDLFIVFANAHDSMPLHDLVSDIDSFADLVDRYVLPPTRLIWLSRIAEDVRRKPKYWREKRYDNGTLTRLQWLDAANRIMYSRMRRRFLDRKNFLLFPDLLQMSKPVLSDFNIDGVHMKSEWYQHVISYILQSICSGE